MIEKTIRDYLAQTLNVGVYTEVPEEFEESYVIIEKTGGRAENHVSTNTFAIQSIGQSMYQASALNEAVKTAMKNIVELNTISACRLQGDYNFTDTRTKQYRYQSVFSLVHFE